MTEGKLPGKFDLPHSESGHNPYWCGGDANGQACGDDPCWNCINFFLGSHDSLVKALEAAHGLLTKEMFDTSDGLVERCKEVGQQIGAALTAAGKGK